MDARLEFYKTDCELILSHIKRQEKQLKLKRRWLMGLPMSKSQENKLSKYRSLPESFLREDDIFYENVKKHVEEAFGKCNTEREDKGTQESKQLFDRTNMKRILLSCLDTLTNKGLYLLAKLLTKGSVSFEKTRKKMKTIIKQCIPEVLVVQNRDHGRIEFFKQLSQLLNDPENIKRDCLTFFIPRFHSPRAAAIKILDRLEDLPLETLLAMHRKLRGVPTRIPHLRQNRCGRSRKKLIYQVRRISELMLSDHGGGDELQEPLAKALAIAGLSLKLTPAFKKFSVTDFDLFSPEIETLQNEIIKAIWLLKTKVRFPELKTLQLLLDPDADVSNRCLRTAMKKLLTEYLFECSDLDDIPKPLLKALDIINRNSRSTIRGCFLMEDVEVEVECILAISAHAKQLLWDLLPHQELDEDFNDAYMEDLKESEDDDDDDYFDDASASANNDDDDVQQLELSNSLSSMSNSIDLYHHEESIGENVPADSRLPTSTHKGTHGRPPSQETRNLNAMHNVDISNFDVERVGKFGTSTLSVNNFLPISLDGTLNQNSNQKNEPELSTGMDVETPVDLPSPYTHKNAYLGVQDVCDEMSMVAYNLIGQVIEGLAHEDGMDLDCSNSSYLGGDFLTQENQEEKRNCSERNKVGSVIVQVVGELLPSLPKSSVDKVKKLMDI